MTDLDVVAEALRDARSGAGSLVVLRGPLGCGRSAALQDVRRLAESTGVRVLSAVGSWQERDFPFAVVHQLTGSARLGLPEVPALVAVDDLQWADEESLRVLADEAGRLNRLPVLMVVCVRDGDVGSGSTLVDQVVRRAGRTVRLARPLLPDRWKLVTCLRAQPSHVRAVLDAMAVLGDADAGLTAPLAEVDETGCAVVLRQADRLGLVDEVGPRFAHPSVRDAVEETMAPANRVRLRHRAVRLLHDRGAPAEVVAGRLLEMACGLELWAVEVLRTAAAVAMARGLPGTAAEYLRRALAEEPRAGGRRAVLLVDLAAAERGVDRAAATAHLSVAAGMAGTARERAAIAARFVPGALAEAPPSVRELLWDIEDELPHADVPDDLALRVEARSHHADCATPVSCVDRLSHSRRREFPATAAERELMAVRLHCATTASFWRAGDVAVVAEQLLAHEPPRPDHVHTPVATLVTTLCATGSADVLTGWLDDAAEQAPAAERIFVEAEQVLVLLHSGRIAEAHDVAERVLTAVGTRRPDAEVLVALSSLARHSGDLRLADRLIPLFQDRTHVPALAVAHQMLCGVTAEDLRTGLACLRHAGSQLNELGWRNPVLYPWRAEAARLLWRLGDGTAARDLAAEHHALAVEWGAEAGVAAAVAQLESMTEGGAAVRRTEGDRPLTGAQRRAVELALAGHSNQEIADLTGVAVRVVEKHLTNAYRRLGVQGRSRLTASPGRG